MDRANVETSRDVSCKGLALGGSLMDKYYFGAGNGKGGVVEIKVAK